VNRKELQERWSLFCLNETEDKMKNYV